MSKTRPGRAPPLPRGRWCAPDRRLSSGRHLPLSNGQSLRPRWNIPSAGVTFTRRHRGFTHVRPSPHTAGRRVGSGSSSASRRSSPRPRPPDGTGTASASTPGFAPRGYPRRTPRRRQAIAHWPEYYTLDTTFRRTSKRCLPLHSCTLTSHVVDVASITTRVTPKAINRSAMTCSERVIVENLRTSCARRSRRVCEGIRAQLTTSAVPIWIAATVR